jgi:hypothetical protein
MDMMFWLKVTALVTRQKLLVVVEDSRSIKMKIMAMFDRIEDLECDYAAAYDGCGYDCEIVNDPNLVALFLVYVDHAHVEQLKFIELNQIISTVI